ncbi:DEAD/DEAH box helicase [Microlunatus spumicola]|uniref:DEAD/DEAH box helicase n=1 Tax=Microlunatus spumicola TaxID=81499 RepID=A0ABP6XRE7_9ACTN
MTANINAVATAEAIKAQYRRYLQSLMTVRDPVLDAALHRAITDTSLLDKGPYLEATPPYAPGATLQDLVNEGVLEQSFLRLASEGLPMSRPLYRHQDEAVRKVAGGRNVVVSTGTGSGKTESFLIPILSSLLREEAAGRLGPGVRALLLYPMNALANDQMKRLRTLLSPVQGITFGRYTGETINDPLRAEQMFEQLNPGEPRLRNELLSRQEIRDTPPHLLITNYAMLEYLLLRPQDSISLFPTDDDGNWRFIVVDEAHVYDGAQGAEISMLLRRLRDRVAPDRKLQCIATSATVGAEGSPSAVTKFAQDLFGQPFEWVEGDPDRQDLVRAARLAESSGSLWGPLSSADYLRLVSHNDRPGAVLSEAIGHGYVADNPSSALRHEASLTKLRAVLTREPATLTSLAQQIFPEEADREAGLAAMVDLASGLAFQDGTPVLSARYHLFLRATEGAFTCLSDSGPHVQLARHERCTTCEAQMFEIGSCKRCGAVHVLGRIETRAKQAVLIPRRAAEPAVWLVLEDTLAFQDEDEEAAVDHVDGLVGDKAKLCPACGTLNDLQAASCASALCGATTLRTVTRLKERGEEIAGCLVCGGRGPSTVRVFETGADAAGAVIATSLYQNLPASDRASDLDQPGEGRKLLMFSDSRQGAAYFAPYFEDSYRRLQRRRLIAAGFQESRFTEPRAVDEVIDETRTRAAAVKMFGPGLTAQQQRREIAPWVMAEVLSTDDRQSLEGLGLIRITLDTEGLVPPKPLLALGLDDADAVSFLQELMRTLRQQGAVTMPDNVPPNDEVFAPRLGPIYVRGEGPEPLRKVLSWLPGRGTNRRIDYVGRLLRQLGSDEDPRRVLEGAWKYLSNDIRPIGWLTRSTDKLRGHVQQVDHRLLRLEWLGEGVSVYRCGRCRRMAPVSVRGVCPALGCEGRLEPFVPPTLENERDHYRMIYRSMNAVSLTASEHTAQWQSIEAAHIQQQFIRGEVNALSCSTTFELGVDVGELQAVMMRNMPPTTANYVQRAGRAGRRAGAAALVVTYAQRRSHDLTRYANPETVLAGVMRPPYIPLENERLDRRHVHSIALAAFFRWYFEATGRISSSAGDFFLSQTVDEAPPVDLVPTFLQPVPTRVRESLQRVVPEVVQEELDLAGDGWVRKLVHLLDEVRAELAADVSLLEQLRDQAASSRKYSLAQRYESVVNTLRGRPLLGYLGNRNVIPKYGFPVDVVELRTNYSMAQHGLGSRLELSRDLAQAIHEYAPDATVAAGGQMWTSRGIYKLPGKDLVQISYRICERCGLYRESHDNVDPACSRCGHVATSVLRKLVIPEFGFVAAKEPIPVGSRPPQRSWSGASYVVKQSEDARDRTIQLPGGQISATVGPRGRLMAVADGPGGAGFWVCDWCGWATAAAHTRKKPTSHEHLFKSDKCSGPTRLLNLGHQFETDLLRLEVQTDLGSVDEATWNSVLYALIESASALLEIAASDVNGTVTAEGIGTYSLMLFDTVPGGAGSVIKIYDHLEETLRAALRRVSECDCGRETSCYGCLRSYRNQRQHDLLSRGAAGDLLSLLLYGSLEHRPDGAVEFVDLVWADLLGQATDEVERAVILGLGSTHEDLPRLGYETDEGVPVGISWPDRQIAVDHELTDEERDRMHSAGWRLVPPEAEAVIALLRSS